MPHAPLIRRLGWLAYWLGPSLICLWLHRDGLHAWFQADDFAWLGMNTEYFDAKSFWHAVFTPAPQGNIRPFSERLFFFGSWHWFGLKALPARIVVMATQCVNLVLLSALVRRASGSKVAGFAAPVLWVGNSVMVTAMAWTSAYSEVLCAFCMLTALTCWARFCESGSRWLYGVQLAIFLFGFSVLEVNLIYPALTAVWAWFYRRERVVWTAPLFALSAAFYSLHVTLAPTPATGPYHPEFSLAIFQTLAKYWGLALVPSYGFITVQPVLATVLLGSATLGVAAFLFAELRARRYAAPFFACWFLLVLGPLLPFRNHISDYYLSIPLAGLAAVMALALARYRIAAAAVVALYLAVQVPTLGVGERWLLDRSLMARTLVLGVKQIHEWEPAKAILLTNVSKDLYGVAVADIPFRLVKGAQVYLAPEAINELNGLPENLAPVSNFVLPLDPVRHALLEGKLVVYSAANGPLREVTAEYTAQALNAPAPELPRRVDAGAPLLGYLLGPEWYPVEGAYRWMPRHATLRMAGPHTANDRLYINGYTSAESRKLQPLILTVTVDGHAVTTALGPNDANFMREIALPKEAVGKPEITILLDVNHTSGRERELGLVFGTFEIR